VRGWRNYRKRKSANKILRRDQNCAIVGGREMCCVQGRRWRWSRGQRSEYERDLGLVVALVWGLEAMLAQELMSE
jgi:hypothetical protein